MDLSPAERDALVRTVIGEAAGQPDIGQTAVAAVALNRLRSGRYGDNMADVLFAPNQFEPWQRYPRKLLSYAPDSPEYKAAADAVDTAAMGIDPTNGATHFYAPAAQAALGRAAPKWAQGDGQRIGGHVFYAPEGSVKRTAQAQAPASDMPDIDSLYQTFAPSAAKKAPAPAAFAPAAPAADDGVDVESLYKQFAVKPEDMPKPAPTQDVAPTGKPGVLATVPEDGTLSTAAANKARQFGTGVVKGVGTAVNPAQAAQGAAGAILSDAQSIATGKPYNDVAAENEARAANPPAIEPPSWVPGWYPKVRDFLHGLHGAVAPENVLPDIGNTTNKLLGVTGEAVPQGLTDRLLQAGGTAVGAALGPGFRGSSAGEATPNMLMTVARQAPAMAASGAAAEYGTEASGHPLVGMAAGMAPAAAVGAERASVNRLTGTVDAETAQLADLARSKYGIPVTADQLSASPAMRFAGSVLKRLPFSGAGDNAAEIQTNFNRSVANTFGEDATKVTPKVMAQARDRIGNEFDAVARSTNIRPDRQIVQGMHSVLTDAGEVLEPPQLGLLQKQAGKFWDALQNDGQISGEQYQAWTRRGGPLDRLENSTDPNVKHYAGQLRDVLDDALERNTPSDMLGQLRQARYQWKNMRTVEDLVAKAPDGNISPALLQGRVNAKNKGTYGAAYGGGGDLKELADVGQRFLKEPQSSGTSERTALMYMLSTLGGAGAAVASGQPANALLALGAGGLALGAGRAIGGTMRSNWLANDTIARSLGRAPAPGLANKLLQSGAPAVLTQR